MLAAKFLLCGLFRKKLENKPPRGAVSPEDAWESRHQIGENDTTLIQGS